MKIAIATVQAPFVSGGAELLALNLKDALLAAGHEAELVTIPFMDTPPYRLENHIVASRLFDLEWSWAGKIDLCIGLKFPAYFIPHPNKVIWALHQHRSLYDLFGTPYSNIEDNAEGREIRDIVKRADETYLLEAKRIYTISQNVADRMWRYNSITSTPLYHPCPSMDEFYCGEFDDYIIMPSRINTSKRQILAVEAMSFVKSDIKLYIVGKADNPIVAAELKALVKEKKLEKRIVFLDFVPTEEKLKLYANARAVLFTPFDEDLGYITIEAMAARKPVITCTDSGGPLEFILDGKSGFITEPEPKALAERIDQFASVNLAREMGAAGHYRLKEMNITWDNVVKELTKP